jgi:phage tail-like protein
MEKRRRQPMGETLYNLLPPVYHREDAKIKPDQYPLKRFLQVNGVGLDFMRGKIDGRASLFDLDNTPVELLPHLAKMLGFDFPYDMSVKEQRNMLKLLPTLYKMKGTQSVFDYLSRQIFGLDAKAYSDWVSRGGDNGENLIRINIEANGETANLQTRIDRYYKYSDKFRPVNHKLFWSIILHYVDEYKRQDKMSVEYMIDILKMNEGIETFNRSKLGDLIDFQELKETQTDAYTFRDREEILLDLAKDLNTDIYNENRIVTESFLDRLLIDDSYPLYDDRLVSSFILNSSRTSALQGEIYDKTKINVFYTDLLLDSSEEVYNKIVVEEENPLTIKNTELDTYSKPFRDDHGDIGRNLTHTLGMGTLNGTMILNKKPAITTY